MLLATILFIIGLLLLIKGGDWFVDGSCGIARRFHIPELLIGATVVSIGTTLPEVMVSASAALSGHSEIAYGNAIGSIICNTALIAAITVTVKPSLVDRKPLKLPVIFFYVAAIFYCFIAYFVKSYSRIVGIILLSMFVVYIAIQVVQALKDMKAGKDEPVVIENPFWKDIFFLVIGAAFIAVGARLLVDNGTIIAKGLGVPESVIGLTFVALGTSLPELVTAITALSKGHGALSLGNIIGANLFNLVLVSGLSITLCPFDLPASKLIAGMNASLVVDIPVMFAVMSILVIPALVQGRLKRWQGITLLSIYTAFIIFQFFI